jgi:putative transposase
VVVSHEKVGQPAGMDVSQAQEAKQLRDENTRLRKLVADLSLDKDMLQAVIAKNGWGS